MATGAFYGEDSNRSKLLKKYDFIEEETEILVGKYGKTGFPQPEKKFRLSWEVYDLSLEEPYFWILEKIQQAFPIVEKLEDSFAAAENSAFFGITQQKLGGQQDKISQFLATTGKMIKELFQMVREIRILKERLTYYRKAESQLTRPIDKRQKGADITLKGFFVDLVQGGGKSAASVYGMARELEFITLPDLFFDAPPFKNQTELEDHVKNLEKDFNQNLLRVLIRHLTQFTEWKKQTSSEHKQRLRFMLQYLLQHFNIIKMYISWVKPYLRHVEKLTLKSSSMRSPELVSAFEGSMLDVELLARIRDPKTGANGCLLATFNYRTRPEMKVVQEGYQRGPVHVGRFEVNYRVYGWNDKEVENYKKLKEEEIYYLMGEISASVQKSMEALGEELDIYLAEAEANAGLEGKEKKKEQKTEQEAKTSLMQKFFGDFYRSKAKSKAKVVRKSRRQKFAEDAAYKKSRTALVKAAKGSAWIYFHTFKKGHRMIAW